MIAVPATCRQWQQAPSIDSCVTAADIGDVLRRPMVLCDVRFMVCDQPLLFTELTTAKAGVLSVHKIERDIVGRRPPRMSLVTAFRSRRACESQPSSRNYHAVRSRFQCTTMLSLSFRSTIGSVSRDKSPNVMSHTRGCQNRQIVVHTDTNSRPFQLYPLRPSQLVLF